MECIYKLVFIILFCAGHSCCQPTQKWESEDNTHCHRFDQERKESWVLIQKLQIDLYKQEMEITNLNHLNSELQKELGAEKQLSEDLKQEVKEHKIQMVKLNESLQNCCHASSPACDPDFVEWLAGGKKFKDTYQNVLTKIIETNKTEIISYNSGAGNRMSIVDNKLWIASVLHKIILSVELSNGISVEIKQSTYTDSFYQYSENSILMASASGLYVVNTTGSIQYKIGDSNSWVTDIAVEDNVGVAYYPSNKSIIILELKNNIWKIRHSFFINLHHINNAGTILLMQNKIVFCAFDRDVVQTYTLQGQLTRNVTTGQLSGPTLCGSDIEGSILICNESNRVLKVLTPSGEWQQYALPGIGNQKPRDVVINSKGEMYVLLSDYPMVTIVKYIM